MHSKGLTSAIIIVIMILLSLLGWNYKNEILWHITDPSGNRWLTLAFYSTFTILTAFIAVPMGIISKVLAGWLFGFTSGSIISHISLIFGSCLAFFLSRYLGKEYFHKKYSKQLNKLNNRLTNHELLTVLRIRLFPFIPLQISNYVIGITDISAKNFFIGSFIGMLPATLFYAALGSQINVITEFKFSTSQLIPYYIFIFSLLLISFIFDFFPRRNYTSQVTPHLRKILENCEPHTWDEQALPSYLHGNFLVRWTFWKRITASINIAPSGKVVLDYGSGAGAMLPWLVRGYEKIYCFDTHSDALAMNQELCMINNWSNVSALAMSEGKLLLESHSVDTIFALDVLEHVDDLPTLLIEFARILKPGGKFVVSSPTENFLYKLVRRFAGPGYQGEFHLRAANEVESDIMKTFRLKLRKRIFPFFTFFRIVEATKK